ncbi:TetR/AcrR family transcriptional regulator [Pseudonocardia acaciae]|uniref:TetR/AcrR family transcriptional regulator n=1 Tax=Pseudonocardia acaciae TaxID=551276 RepID=UPI00048CFE44|nr:TetR family transcriptional regulator [Pseudonocardia acaciae]
MNARGRRTRAALLSAARELVERDGLAALTMAEVAERAGRTRRAVYLHFSTRTELLLALFAHVAEVEDLAGSLAPVRAEPDPVRKLDEWARHLARYAPRIRAMAHAVDAMAHTDPDAGARDYFARQGQRDDAAEIVAALHSSGLLAAALTQDVATDLLYALSALEVFERLTVDRGWSPDRYAQHLTTVLRATLVSAR